MKNLFKIKEVLNKLASPLLVREYKRRTKYSLWYAVIVLLITPKVVPTFSNLEFGSQSIIRRFATLPWPHNSIGKWAISLECGYAGLTEMAYLAHFGGG